MQQDADVPLFISQPSNPVENVTPCFPGRMHICKANDTPDRPARVNPALMTAQANELANLFQLTQGDREKLVGLSSVCITHSILRA